MLRVFLSYRRSDSEPIANRLSAALRTRGFGVFRDREAIRAGAVFGDVLEAAIGGSDVVLVLIGRNWLHATAPTGERRLEQERDYVRMEIARGLGCNALVVPVLIDNTPMPRDDELPADIRPLARRNHFRIRPEEVFEAYVDALAAQIRTDPSVVDPDPAPPPPSRPAEVRRSLADHLVEYAAPRAHRWLAEHGWFPDPPDRRDVHNYLTWFEDFVRQQLRPLAGAADADGQYVPVRGENLPAAPALGGEYGDPDFPDERSARREVLRVVRQTICALTDLAPGGDQATARSAGSARRKSTVRDVAALLLAREEPTVLLGEPGSGKSTTLREAGRRIAAAGRRRARPVVVVYVRLGEYRSQTDGRPGDVWELVRKSVPEPHRAVAARFDELARERRLVVLFDGMDEMERGLYGPRVTALSDFARAEVGRVRCLFACRTNDFSPRFEHRQLVLLEFDARQVRDYLRANLGRTARVDGADVSAADLAARLLADPDLADLARNPQTLSLLGLYVRRRGTLPASRRDLFENYLAGLARRLGDVGPAARAGWERLAYRTTGQHAGTSLELAGLRAAWGADDADRVVNAGLRCGALVIDESDDQAVRFVHHRVQEYLTACHLAGAEAAAAGTDWAGLIDTPRWQETLVSLASIQREVSPALRVVFESLREVAAGPPGVPPPEPDEPDDPADLDAPIEDEGDDDEGDDDEAAESDAAVESPPAAEAALRPRWPWPTDDERRLAARVTLAARVVREVGADPGRYPDGFLDAFRAALEGLTRDGRPTTQVKMLWAWGDAMTVVPRAALTAAARSEVGWVREQALLVLGGRAGRARAAAELRSELAVDLTGGGLVSQFRSHLAAARAAGDRGLYAALAWAVVAWVVYGVVAAGAVAGVCALVAALWPPGGWVPAAVPAGAAGLGVAGLALSVAAVPFSAAGYWRRAMYLAAVGCGLVYAASQSGGTRAFSSYMLLGTCCGAVALGLIAAGLQAAFWASFGVYVAAVRPDRDDTLMPVVRKNARTEDDTTLIRTGAAVLGVIAGFWLLRVVLNAIDTHVWSPTKTFLGRQFDAAWDLFAAHPWLWAVAVAGVALLAWRAGGGRRGWTYLSKIRERGWAATAGDLAWGVLKVAWVLVSQLVVVAGWLLLAMLGIAAVVMPFVLLAYGAGEGLEALGVNKTDRERLPLVAVHVLMISTVLFALLVTTQQAWVAARARMGFGRWRRPPTAEAWVRAVGWADPHGQLWLLRNVSPTGYGLTTAGFQVVLEGLEAVVTAEPAASEYWRVRHRVEDIIRQEVLAVVPGIDPPRAGGEAPPPPDPRAAAPAPAGRWRRLSRRTALAALLLAAGAQILNTSQALRRPVCVVNGLPEEVVVELAGRAIRVPPGGHVELTLPEDTYPVTTRRAGRDPHTHTLDIRAGYWERFTDRRVFVVNPEGAAVLEWFAGFVHVPEYGWVPDEREVWYGRPVFETPDSPDYRFPARELRPDTDAKVTALRLAHALPAHVFLDPPAAWTDEYRFAWAERTLAERPSDELLDAYVGALCRAGRADRCRDFLRGHMTRPRPPAWHRQWQGVNDLLGDAAAVRDEYRRRLAAAPNNAVLTLQNGRLLPTVRERLAHFDRARELAPELLEPLAEQAFALTCRSDFAGARRVVRAANLLSPEVSEPQRLTGTAWALAAEEVALNLALGDRAAAQTALAEIDRRNPFTMYSHSVRTALDARDGADRARDRHRRLAEGSRQATVAQGPFLRGARDQVASAAYFLHHLLGEPSDALRAADGFPAGLLRDYSRSLALLELGDAGAAESAYRPPYAEWKAQHLLRVSVAAWAADRPQPNRPWRDAEAAFRDAKDPVSLAVAGMLAAAGPPDLDAIRELALSPADKAVLLVALAQRFRESRPAALDVADGLAFSPFAPAPFARRVAATTRAAKQ
ncbi:MAG TPA: TIR domain-containing protein [Urbifossiella sp.]|nr:TIR domain-containing protein [Urbifossiella sp.]